MDDEYSSNNSVNNDGVSVHPVVNSFANQFVSLASASAGNSNSSINGGGSSRGGGGGTSIEGIRGKDGITSRSTSSLLLYYYYYACKSSLVLHPSQAIPIHLDLSCS